MEDDTNVSPEEESYRERFTLLRDYLNGHDQNAR
jgi:hypothetical protein